MKIENFPWKRILLWHGIILSIFLIPLWRRIFFLGTADWDQHLFWQEAARTTLLQWKEFPLWNPWYCGGNVLLAHHHSRFLYPGFIIELIFGVLVGYKISIGIHLWLAAVGTSFLAWTSGVRQISGLLFAGIVASCSSFPILQLAETHLWMLSYPAIPWILASINLWEQKRISSFRLVTSLAILWALIVFNGGIYPGPLSAVIAIFWVIGSSRPWVGLRNVVLAGVGAFGLSAVKLFPMIFWLMNDRRITRADPPMDFVALLHAFFYPIQKHAVKIFETQSEGWLEYSASPGFIAWIGIGLTLWGFRDLKKSGMKLSRLSLGILFTLILYLGHLIPFGPWWLLKHLPVFESLHIPSRWAMVLLPLLGVFAAFQVRGKWGNVFLLGLVINLFVSHGNAWRETLLIPLESIDLSKRSQVFEHVQDLRLYSSNGPNQLIAIWLNKGVKQCYDDPTPGQFVKAVEESEYFGAAKTLGVSPEPVKMIKWTPNTRFFQGSWKQGDVLVINDNFYPGWRVRTDDTGWKSAENVEGILGASFTKPSSNVEFRFVPAEFIFGTVVSLFSMMTLVLIMYARKRHRKRSGF